MNIIMDLEINKNATAAYASKKYSMGTLVWMLLSRVLLFLVFQMLFFICFSLTGSSNAWNQSADWWPFSVILTNLLSMFLLNRLLKRENRRFLDFFIFNRETVLKDFLLMSTVLITANIVAYAFNYYLGSLLFGDYIAGVNLFYRPLPVWAAWVALFLFPLTMPLGELPIYFGYVMPRLEVISGKKWIAVLLPSLFLSFQHVTMPLLFNVPFILWRMFMFLPLAFFIALTIRWKPGLMPYILIGHVFIDIMNSVMILIISLQ